jgi:phospholipase/lecithinase/hemolysin
VAGMQIRGVTVDNCELLRSALANSKSFGFGNSLNVCQHCLAALSQISSSRTHEHWTRP